MSEHELYHIDDRGRKVDLSDTQKELADEAKERSAEKIAKKIEEDSEMTEDKYMAEFYSKDHDEYLVNGAILECDKAKKEFKIYRGKTYNVPLPDTTTVLNVTENPRAKCCGYLYHATIKDRKAEFNVPPFRCNCEEGPHNDKEWAKLEGDESCLTEGTCKALINLCDEWDNLPTEKSYLMFWNEDRQGMVPGITMSSMLFCRHGGIITAKESGQDSTKQNGIGFGESTILLIMGFESNVGVRVNDNGTYTLGFGYDFTEESDPETFNRYFYKDENGNIKKKRELEDDKAYDTVRLGAEQKKIIWGVDSFINGNGNGNDKQPLVLNQNQYDALFSFFYSNGAYVFTDDVYNSWKSKGGEKADRAEARKNLKEYLIENNGNYDAEKIEELFVDCKGGNLKYEYKDRRKAEAELFMSE